LAELAAGGGGSGDITSVGNVATGAAFDGTQGTTLTFYNAGGNATQTYDGTTFTFSKYITANVTGAVTCNGVLVLSPSATQTIDSATDTILANAAMVILDPGTSTDYTLTSTPTIADGYPGQFLTIIVIPTSNKQVIIQDQDTLANSNIQLPWNNLGIGARDVVQFLFNGTDWCFISKGDN
jgi:hypothetical protein